MHSRVHSHVHTQTSHRICSSMHPGQQQKWGQPVHKSHVMKWYALTQPQPTNRSRAMQSNFMCYLPVPSETNQRRETSYHAHTR